MNGRLAIDIFEALLIDNASTMGEWVSRIESGSESTGSRILLNAVLKAVIPRISGIYRENLLLSPAQARQELDIQHATYNLFGDPALPMAYPQPGTEISPDWLWHPRKGSLGFHGKSELPTGQQVSISLETPPGDVISPEGSHIGTIDGYLQANDVVIQKMNVEVENRGNFSGGMDIPADTPDGKYLLRAVTILNGETYVTAHPVYMGWLSTLEIPSTAIFWWSLIGFLLLRIFVIAHSRAHRSNR